MNQNSNNSNLNQNSNKNQKNQNNQNSNINQNINTYISPYINTNKNLQINTNNTNTNQNTNTNINNNINTNTNMNNFQKEENRPFGNGTDFPFGRFDLFESGEYSSIEIEKMKRKLELTAAREKRRENVLGKYGQNKNFVMFFLILALIMFCYFVIVSLIM